MDFSPNLETHGGREGVKLSVCIVARGARSSSMLRSLVEGSLPPARMTVIANTSRLLPTSQEDPYQIYLLDFSSLRPPDTEVVKNLRKTAPRSWIILVAENREWAAAFNLFEDIVDDILEAGQHLRRALSDSYTRSLARWSKTESGRNVQKLQAVPLLAIADQLLDILILVDSEGQVLFANSAWRDFFPNPSTDRLYLADVVHNVDLHRLEAELQLAIIENTSGKVLFRAQTNSGDWSTIQAAISGLDVEGSRLACLCGRNITTYHRTQLQLGVAERNLKLIESLTSEVVYRIDGWRQELQYISANIQQLSGYSPEEWSADLDGIWSKITDADTQTQRKAILEGLIQRGPGAAGRTITYPITRSGGGATWVEDKISLEWSRDGLHFWVNGILREITIQRESQLEIGSSITDHRRLFDELQEGYAELNLITSPPDQPDFRITSYNQSFEKLAGLSGAKLVNSKFSDLFPGLSETPVSISSGRSLLTLLAETALSGQTTIVPDFYWPHLRSYFKITAIHIKSGWVSLTMIDITPQRQAELRLEAMLHGLPDTVLYQTGGGVEYISHGFERLTGYRPEEFVSDREFFPTLIHPDDQPLIKAKQLEWHKQGSKGVLEMEFRIRRKDGKYIWLLDRMSKAFTTPDGRRFSQGVMIDITARKEAETQIRRKSAEFDLFFQAIPDLYFRLDYDGIILDWRAGAPEDLYIQPDEFIGKRMQDLLPAEIAQKFRDEVSQFREGEKPPRFEYLLEVPRGIQAFEARLFQLPDSQVAVMVRNITEQRRQADALERRQRRLQVLSELSIQINSLTRSSQICDAVANQLLKDASMDPIIFLLGDEQSLVLARAWSRQLDVSDLSGKIINTTEHSYFNTAFASSRPVMVNRQSGRIVELLKEDNNLVQACGIFPLNYRGKLQGVLCICKPESDGFQHGELDELEPISHLLAEALDRAEAMEALEQSNSFLGALYEESPTASWVADASGCIISANKACRKLFQVPEGERFPVSYNIFDNYVYKREGLIPLLSKAFDSGKPVALPSVEYEIGEFPYYKALHPNRVFVATTLIPIKNSMGQVINIVAQIKDMTAERNLQGRLKKSTSGRRKLSSHSSS